MIRQLATINDVSEATQVPVKTLRRWEAQGTGPPAFKLGRHLRYDWADVHRWLASNKNPTDPTTTDHTI